MKSFGESTLYTFVDTAFLRGRDPAEVARELCAGGSDIIQLRAKNEPPDVIKQMAHRILSVTRAAGVPLVINDYPNLATALGAECVHLGQEDFFDAGLHHRSQLTELNAQLGLSSHSPEQALRAIEAAADYIAVGPVFATGTKPGRAPVTLEYVRWAAAHVRLPWFAIGGITLDNLEQMLAAGARRVCVVSAILNASDITRACRDFKSRLS